MDNLLNKDTSGGIYGNFLVTPMPKIGVPNLKEVPILERPLISGRGDRFNTSFKSAFDEYDKYIHGANYQLGGLNEMRAQNQGGWERTGRSFAQLGGTILGQIIAGTGSITKLIANPIATGNMLFGNDSVENYNDTKDNPLGILGHALEQSGIAIQKGIEEALPIYKTKVAEEGGWGKFADPSWWAAMFPTVGSAMASFVPILGAMKGLNVASKLLRTANIVSRGTSGLLSIGANIGRGFEQSRIAQTLTATLFSTHLDVMQEIANQYDSERKYAKTTLGLNDEDANKYVANWAASSYRKGVMSTAIFELGQMHMLLNNGAFVNRFMSDSYKKAGTRYINTSINKGVATAGAEIGTIANTAVKTSFGQKAFELGKMMIAEGAQEMSVDAALSEGKREAKINAGFEDYSLKELHDRLYDFASKGSNWDSFIWGAIGGMTMTLGRGAIQKILYKDSATQEAELIKNNLNTLQTVNEIISKFDTTNKTAGQTVLDKVSIIAPIVRQAASNGTLGMTNNLFDAIAKLDGSSTADLATLGYTQNSIEVAKELRNELDKANKIYNKSFEMIFDSTDDKVNSIIQDNHGTQSYLLDYFKRQEKTIKDLIESERKDISDQIDILTNNKSKLDASITDKWNITSDLDKQLISNYTLKQELIKTIADLESAKIKLDKLELSIKGKPGPKSKSHSDLRELVSLNEKELAHQRPKLDLIQQEIDRLKDEYDKSLSEYHSLRNEATINILTIADRKKELQDSKSNKVIANLRSQLFAYYTQTRKATNELNQITNPTTRQEYIDSIKKLQEEHITNYTELYTKQIEDSVTEANINTIVSTAKSRGIDLAAIGKAKINKLKLGANRDAQIVAESARLAEEAKRNNQAVLTDSFNIGYVQDKTTKQIIAGEVSTKTSVNIGDTVVVFDTKTENDDKGFKVIGFQLSSSNVLNIQLDVNGTIIDYSPNKVYKQGEIKPTKIQSVQDLTIRNALVTQLDELLKNFDATKAIALIRDVNNISELNYIANEADAKIKLGISVKLGALLSKLQVSDFATEIEYKTEIKSLKKSLKQIDNTIKVANARFSLIEPVRRLLFNANLTGITNPNIITEYYDLMNSVIDQIAKSHRYVGGKLVLYNKDHANATMTLVNTIDNKINAIETKITFYSTPDINGDIFLNEASEYRNLLTEIKKVRNDSIDFRRKITLTLVSAQIEDLQLSSEGLVDDISKNAYYSKEVKAKLIADIKKLNDIIIRLTTESDAIILNHAQTSLTRIQYLFTSITNSLSTADLNNTGYIKIKSHFESTLQAYDSILKIPIDAHIDIKQDQMFQIANSKFFDIFSMTDVEREETFDSIVSRSTDLNAFSYLVNQFSKDLNVTSDRADFLVKTLGEVQFENIEKGLRGIWIILESYKNFAGINSEDKVQITFDDLLKVLAYHDVSGENMVEQKWDKLFDSLRLVQEVILNPIFMKSAKLTIDTMDKSDPRYVQATADYRDMVYLKDNLAPIPSRKDYMTSTQADVYFTKEGIMKWEYIKDWIANDDGSLRVREIHPGSHVNITILKLLSDPKVYDKLNNKYLVDSIDINGISFTINEIYQGLATLQRGGLVDINIDNLNETDLDTKLDIYITINNKKLTLGQIQPSNIKIGEYIDATHGSEGVSLVVKDGNSLVFRNYLTDEVRLNNAIDLITTKTFYKVIKQFYIEYTKQRQVSNHKYERYQQLFNELDALVLPKNKGADLINWLKLATNETNTELNPHKVYAILSTVFYGIPDSLLEQYSPNVANVRSRFSSYRNKLEHGFTDSKRVKDTLLTKRRRGDLTSSIAISHLSKPSLNFAGSLSIGNKVNDEVAPTIYINGQSSNELITTLSPDTKNGRRTISNVTTNTVVDFTRMALSDELINRKSILFTVTRMFAGEEGVSYIPLRSANVNMFGNEEFAKNSVAFISSKFEQLLSATDSIDSDQTGIYNINDGTITCTTKDVLDDLADLISIGNTDHGITVSAEEGQNVYFRFGKYQEAAKDKNGNPRRSIAIEFRTVDIKGNVLFHQIKKYQTIVKYGATPIADQYVYRTVKTTLKKGIHIANLSKTKSFNGKAAPNWQPVSKTADTLESIIRLLTITNNKGESTIGNMIRSVPLTSNTKKSMKRLVSKSKGKSIGQNFNNSADLNNPYISVVDAFVGKIVEYKNIQDFLIKTGAVYSNIQAVRNNNGDIISNHTLFGRYPISMNVDVLIQTVEETSIDKLRKLTGDNFISNLLSNKQNVLSDLELDGQDSIPTFLNYILTNYGDVKYQHLDTQAEWEAFAKLNNISTPYSPNDLAYTHPATKSIITLGSLRRRPDSDNRTKLELFHELLHLAIKSNTTIDTQVQQDIAEYVKDLKNRIAEQVANKTINLTEAEQNVLNNWIKQTEESFEEFITYPFTNKDLAVLLNRLDHTSGITVVAETFWDKLLNLIARLFIKTEVRNTSELAHIRKVISDIMNKQPLVTIQANVVEETINDPDVKSVIHTNSGNVSTQQQIRDKRNRLRRSIAIESMEATTEPGRNEVVGLRGSVGDIIDVILSDNSTTDLSQSINKNNKLFGSVNKLTTFKESFYDTSNLKLC